MIQQLFFALLIIAMGSFLIVHGRRRRTWSVVLLLVASFFMYNLWTALEIEQSGFYAYSWLPKEFLNVHFYLSSSLRVEKVIFSLLGVLLGLIYLNIIYKEENHSLNINTLLLLVFSALIVLISARDFIQLMFGSCAFAVLSFYMVNDVASRGKFIFYNIFSEMAIFTALAIIYGETGIIELENLPTYVDTGQHKALVSCLIIGAIFAKAAVFPFQNQLLAFQDISFNRVIVLSLFSAPLSSLFILSKLYPLINMISYEQIIWTVILSVSFLWAIIGTLMADNIKAKTQYFNMAFWTFLLLFVNEDASRLYSGVLNLLLPLFLLNVCFLMICVSASNEVYVSQMGAFAKKIKFTLFLSILASLSFCLSLSSFEGVGVNEYICLSLFLLATIFNGIYFGKDMADEKVSALLHNAGFLYCFPLFIMILLEIYLNFTLNSFVYVGWGISLILMLVWPGFLSKKFADNELIQEGDWIYELYHLIILSPLRLLGRILWIAVDFVVIERSIIGSISKISSFLIVKLHKLQEATWLNYFLMTLVGTAILIIALGRYVHE